SRTDEWALEVNAERPCSHRLSLGRDHAGQSIEGSQNAFHWRRDRGGEITGNAVPAESSFEGDAAGGVVLHDIVAGTAVYVDIDVSRGQDQIGEVQMFSAGGKISFCSRSDRRDFAIFNYDHAGFDRFQRREYTAGSNAGSHEGRCIVADWASGSFPISEGHAFMRASRAQ